MERVRQFQFGTQKQLEQQKIKDENNSPIFTLFLFLDYHPNR